MQRLHLCLLSLLFATVAAAAPLGPVAKAEIDGLMSRLETSGCRFNRNGSWHTAADAKSHLLKKLKYLEDRGAVQSAEQFIALAASSSSASGDAYLVKCGGDAALPSAVWLRSQLQVMRAAGPATSTK